MGTAYNQNAIGALTRWSAEGVVRSRLKTSRGGYLPSHDPREVLSLGKATKLDWVEIHWPAPSDRLQRFEDLPVDTYVTLTEE